MAAHPIVLVDISANNPTESAAAFTNYKNTPRPPTAPMVAPI